MTLEEAEEDFIFWNEFWMKGCYDPETERDLWEAKQGEVDNGEKESRTKKQATRQDTV